jgi:hypothetical protein
MRRDQAMPLRVLATIAFFASIYAGNSVASATVANAPQKVIRDYGNGLIVALICGSGPTEPQKATCHIEAKIRTHKYRIELDQKTTRGYTGIYHDFIVFGSAEHANISIRLPVDCGNWQNDRTQPTDFLDCSLRYEQKADGFKLRCLEKNGLVSGVHVSECIAPDEIQPPMPHP